MNATADNITFFPGFNPWASPDFWEGPLLEQFDATDEEQRRLVVAAAYTAERQYGELKLRDVVQTWLQEGGLDAWDAAQLWARAQPDPRAIYSLSNKLKQREFDELDATATLDEVLESGEADEEPEFVVRPFIPKREATLLAAMGGIGKTYLALILALCIASGRRFLGLEVEQGSVLFVTAEDYRFILANRLKKIAAHPFFSLIARNEWTANARDSLHLWEVIGQNLWKEQKGNIEGMPTGMMRQLERRIQKTKAALVVLDNASSLFRGGQMNGDAVNAFVTRIRLIARRRNCAILLLGHVNAESATSNGRKNYFGSTQWNDACRSRLALSPIEANDGIAAHIVLTHEKTNHGELAKPIKLRRDEQTGILQLVTAAEIAGAKEAKASGDAAELIADIRTVYEKGSVFLSAISGPRNFYTSLSEQLPTKYPDGDKTRRSAAKAALSRLVAEGLLLKSTRRTEQRNVVSIWIPAP